MIRLIKSNLCKSCFDVFMFLQPHYVPDNYKRNGGRSAWKSERSKEAADCEDDGSPCDRGEDFPHGPEDGRPVEDDVNMTLEDPQLLSAKPGEKERAKEGDEEEEEEEEEEGLEAGVRKELGESAEDRIGEMLELPLSSSSSPLHHPALSRREAQRERLNKILLDLLHRAPSKNGEGPGARQGGRSTDTCGLLPHAAHTARTNHF